MAVCTCVVFFRKVRYSEDRLTDDARAFRVSTEHVSDIVPKRRDSSHPKKKLSREYRTKDAAKGGRRRRLVVMIVRVRGGRENRALASEQIFQRHVLVVQLVVRA